MLREIIKPTSEYYSIHIPKEYINQEIEILVLPFSYEKENKVQQIDTNDIFASSSGILKYRNIDPIKWQEEIRNDREI